MNISLSSLLLILAIVLATVIAERVMRSWPWTQRYWLTRSFRGSKYEWPVRAALFAAFVAYVWLSSPGR